MALSPRPSAGLVGAGLILLAGTAFLTGCTPSHAADTGSVSPQIASDVTGWLFPATVPQAVAGAEFQNTITTLRDNQFKVCLSKYGFGARAQLFGLAARPLVGAGIPTAPGYQNPGAPTLGLVNLAVVSDTKMLSPIYVGNRYVGTGFGVSASEEAAVMVKSQPCWNHVMPLSAPLQSGPVFALRSLWGNTVDRLTNSAAAQSANQSFGTCTTGHGAPESAGASLAAFASWLNGAVNGTQFTNSLSPSATARQLDAHWSAIFAQCAAPVVSVMQSVLPAAQKSFVQRHFQQITAVEKLVATAVLNLQKTH
jgi:hypothetical protein